MYQSPECVFCNTFSQLTQFVIQTLMTSFLHWLGLKKIDNDSGVVLMLCRHIARGRSHRYNFSLYEWRFIPTHTHTYSPTQRCNMHNTSFEGSITQLHKQHTVLEKETKSKSTRKGVVSWVLPKSMFKNKMLAVVKEDGCLPDLFPLFIPFPAKECVLLMQFLQRRVLQKDSANQKCPSSSSLLRMSMHQKSEFLLTLFAQP